MVQVTYITFQGEEHRVQGQTGQSVMQLAKDKLVPGIDADCGGACACATCHVYVDQAYLAKTGLPATQESDMLDVVDDRRPNSRLSCQIKLSDELEGLVVRLPESQH